MRTQFTAMLGDLAALLDDADDNTRLPHTVRENLRALSMRLDFNRFYAGKKADALLEKAMTIEF